MPLSSQLMIGAGAVGVIALAMAASGKMSSPRHVKTDKSHLVASAYLSPEQRPDSLALVPPPPADGSKEMQRDMAARDTALKLRGTARYRQAAEDALFAFPQIPRDFSCALGIEIDHDRTPRLYNLMARLVIDVRASTYRAKHMYKRARPFDLYQTRTCLPNTDLLRSYSSYPSGQGALGWVYGLVLADLNPARADQIIQRGRDFGESRIICDAEWLSDVEAGRTVGTATLATLRELEEFQVDFKAAQAEVQAALRSRQALPARCAELSEPGKPLPVAAGLTASDEPRS